MMPDQSGNQRDITVERASSPELGTPPPAPKPVAVIIIPPRPTELERTLSVEPEVIPEDSEMVQDTSGTSATTVDPMATSVTTVDPMATSATTVDPMATSATTVDPTATSATTVGPTATSATNSKSYIVTLMPRGQAEAMAARNPAKTLLFPSPTRASGLLPRPASQPISPSREGVSPVVKKRRRKTSDLLTAPASKRPRQFDASLAAYRGFPQALQHFLSEKRNQNSQKKLNARGKAGQTNGGASSSDLPEALARFPASLEVPRRTAAIVLVSRLSAETSLFDLINAFKRSRYAAVMSRQKEQTALAQLEENGKVYEDLDVVWDPLCSGTLLEIRDLSPASVGDLLSFGHFIELIQNCDLLLRQDKRSISFEFLRDAVTLKDGLTGPFLYLLNCIYCAMRDINPGFELPCDFAGNPAKMPATSLLNCEFLRHYLLAYSSEKSFPVAMRFLSVVDKLDVLDVADLTVTERVILLSGCQEILIRGTFFVAEIFAKLESRKDDKLIELNEFTDQIKELTQTISELRTQVLSFEEWSTDNLVSRTLGREKEDLQRALDENLRLVEIAMEKRRAAVAESEEIQRILNKSKKSLPLGYDRYHNRYWYFPALFHGVFVESGWFQPLQPPSAAAALSRPAPLANFTIPKGTRKAPTFGRLYRVDRDGSHRKCSSLPEEFSGPPLVDCKWTFFAMDKVAPLIASLCPLGVREKFLQMSLLAVKDADEEEVRPLPDVTLPDAFAGVRDEVVALTDNLVVNQLLSVDFAWGDDGMEGIELEHLKKHVIWLRGKIFKPVLKPIATNSALTRLHNGPTLDHLRNGMTDPWKAAVKATSSLPRFSYLVAVLRQAVDWKKFRITEDSLCDRCSRTDSLGVFQRCHECLELYHVARCANFEENVCTFCRPADYPLRILDMMQEVDEESQKSPRKIRAHARRIDPVMKEQWAELERRNWVMDVERSDGPYSLRAGQNHVSYAESDDDDEEGEEGEEV
ncbi:hypothetical protein BV898_12384 [Hypsibius exemplaris]|uniref:WHIM2 domain-containing protein n=1 Tax=Hypsibius exemplaris TaxID=2072580 RepID=A0A1W0WE04_HYPEX|nr:hypothetical protein BV898_12384 [Hypsibius exemplaris]